MRKLDKSFIIGPPRDIDTFAALSFIWAEETCSQDALNDFLRPKSGPNPLVARNEHGVDEL